MNPVDRQTDVRVPRGAARGYSALSYAPAFAGPASSGTASSSTVSSDPASSNPASSNPAPDASGLSLRPSSLLDHQSDRETDRENGGETVIETAIEYDGQGPARRLEAAEAQIRLLAKELEQRGFAAGLAAARAESAGKRLAQERSLRAAIDAIRQAEASCFARIEPEVVALSLEIAKKVLCHEAQIDRLFLAGAVRYALERLHRRVQGETTPVTLRVAPADHCRWQDFVSKSEEIGGLLTIESDPSVEPGMCLCHSASSVLDLSVTAQLGEIARKFAEVLPATPVLVPAMPPGIVAEQAVPHA